MRRVAAGLLGLLPVAAWGADHTNLDTNLPVRLEDAYTIPYNGIEAQSYFGYSRDRRGSGGAGRGGSDAFTVGPRVELGLARNFQLDLAAPYRLGNAAETKQGDFQAQGLYNFNSEAIYLPALSLGAGVDQPFGYRGGGTETEVEFVATKSVGHFGTNYWPRRLSLNALWFHNYNPLATERRDRYLVGVAYDQPVTNDVVLVADVYREEVRERRQAQNIVQVGTRFQFDPQTVLSASVGTGFGDRSPALVVLFGFQHSLSWPALSW